MDARLLTYKELIEPTNRGEAVIGPGRIPVHPLVYHADLTYTADFVALVYSKLAESIAQDLKAIEDRLHWTPGTVETILGEKHISAYIKSNKQSIDAGFVGSNIALEPKSQCEKILTEPYQFPPFSEERLREFSLTPNRIAIPSWYTHTPGENGFSIYLQLRNFAILVNNLGIQR